MTLNRVNTTEKWLLRLYFMWPVLTNWVLTRSRLTAFEEKWEPKMDSNWGPTAYQPNALPLGQTSSWSVWWCGDDVLGWHDLSKPTLHRSTLIHNKVQNYLHKNTQKERGLNLIIGHYVIATVFSSHCLFTWFYYVFILIMWVKLYI